MWDITVPGNNDHDFYIDTAATVVLVHNCSALNLTYKPGWSSEQMAAADAKVAALNNADKLAITAVERSGSAADVWRAAGNGTVAESDIDHIIEPSIGWSRRGG